MNDIISDHIVVYVGTPEIFLHFLLSGIRILLSVSCKYEPCVGNNLTHLGFHANCNLSMSSLYIHAALLLYATFLISDSIELQIRTVCEGEIPVQLRAKTVSKILKDY